MEISSEKRGNASVVLVKGKIDSVVAPEFEKRMDDLLKQGETRLVIDLSELDYISSAGLRSLLVTAKKLKSQDGRFVIASAKAEVMKVFTISGFTAILAFDDSVESALSQM